MTMGLLGWLELQGLVVTTIGSSAVLTWKYLWPYRHSNSILFLLQKYSNIKNNKVRVKDRQNELCFDWQY